MTWKQWVAVIVIILAFGILLFGDVFGVDAIRALAVLMIALAITALVPG